MLVMRAVLVLVLGSSTWACGETNSESGVGFGGADGGADTGGDTGPDADAPSCVIPQQTEYLKPNRVVGECPVLGAVCVDSPFDGDPLLLATEIDPEARFVAVSGELVLAERPRAEGTNEPIVVWVHSMGDEPFTIAELPEQVAADARGIDVDGHTLLSCAGSECRVDALDPNPPLAFSAAIPVEQGQPEGVVEWRSRDMVCVYGNGLHCFDGTTWHALVPPDSGPRFRAAAANSNSIWAAGDAGRVVLASTECWRELESGTDATLRSLSADSHRELWAVASGDSGTVVYLSLGEVVTCTVGTTTTRVLRDWGETWGYVTADAYDDQWLFQEDGAMIEGKPSIGGNWCVAELGDTVIDASWFTCGVVDNQRALTSQALFGFRFCALD